MQQPHLSMQQKTEKNQPNHQPPNKNQTNPTKTNHHKNDRQPNHNHHHHNHNTHNHHKINYQTNHNHNNNDNNNNNHNHNLCVCVWLFPRHDRSRFFGKTHSIPAHLPPCMYIARNTGCVTSSDTLLFDHVEIHVATTSVVCQHK